MLNVKNNKDDLSWKPPKWKPSCAGLQPEKPLKMQNGFFFEGRGVLGSCKGNVFHLTKKKKALFFMPTGSSLSPSLSISIGGGGGRWTWSFVPLIHSTLFSPH